MLCSMFLLQLLMKKLYANSSAENKFNPAEKYILADIFKEFVV